MIQKSRKCSFERSKVPKKGFLPIFYGLLDRLDIAYIIEVTSRLTSCDIFGRFMTLGKGFFHLLEMLTQVEAYAAYYESTEKSINFNKIIEPASSTDLQCRFNKLNRCNRSIRFNRFDRLKTTLKSSDVEHVRQDVTVLNVS